MKRKRSSSMNVYPEKTLEPNARLLSPNASPVDLLYQDSRQLVGLLSGLTKNSRWRPLFEPNLIPMMRLMTPTIIPPSRESFNYVPGLRFSDTFTSRYQAVHPDIKYIMQFMYDWCREYFLITMGGTTEMKTAYKEVCTFFKKKLDPFNMSEQTLELKYLVLKYIEALEEFLFRGNIHSIYGTRARTIDPNFPNDPMLYVQSLRLQIIEYTRNVVQAMRRMDYTREDLENIQIYQRMLR